VSTSSFEAGNQATHENLDIDTLYHTYKQRIYRQCFRIVQNQADAEDLTQEVFLRLFQKVDSFRGQSRFSTWLHRLTFNLVLMELRKQHRRPVASVSLTAVKGSEDDLGGRPGRERIIQVSANPLLERVNLEIALAQLPSGYRKIFILHDAEGYRHDEIAQFLGISEGTSKSQLHKARYRLRALLQKGGASNPREVEVVSLAGATEENRKGASHATHVAAA
jgi:RNA polymerase sigma-70 factor (ECF subfamily)